MFLKCLHLILFDRPLLMSFWPNSDKETSTPSHPTMMLAAPKSMILSWTPPTFSANVTEYDAFLGHPLSSLHNNLIYLC